MSGVQVVGDLRAVDSAFAHLPYTSLFGHPTPCPAPERSATTMIGIFGFLVVAEVAASGDETDGGVCFP